MLMMSRREGEVILIGEDVELVIAHIGRTRVKVGIRAPRSMAVIARELKLVREENLAAAARPGCPPGRLPLRSLRAAIQAPASNISQPGR
jgi:carbon storage regulator